MTKPSTNKDAMRIERDSMGELAVPATALWGAQTQRAVDNFALSGTPMPPSFIRALAYIKWAAAEANGRLELLSPQLVKAIQNGALQIAAGKHAAHFPVDVFQTGSGTSTNMNVNEVIARLAVDTGVTVHPNDHVNMGQSSNDVIPAAIHLSMLLELQQSLLPALKHLRGVIDRKADEVATTVTTGRTHLMDAMPITFKQILSGWSAQVGADEARLQATLPRLRQLAIGGTAVGTGVNAHPQFAQLVCELLRERLRVDVVPSENYFAALSSQDTAVEVSGQLKVTAVSLMKIANDLRWMNSGPLAGIGEISLPALQPGSSIMPGKVNPVIPEAVGMIAAQVIGYDAALAVAGQSGNFQLNVMLPLIAHNLLQSLSLLTHGARSLADKAIAGFTINHERIAAALNSNPILVTALNPIIGYERAAAIAKRAYVEQRRVLDVAKEMTDIPENDLVRLLDPMALTLGGILKKKPANDKP